MRVDEAVELFAAIPRIQTKLKTICDVGLGYIAMGQPATQLSGGEAQRIKLATELSKRATGRTFYVLDEPTTGLHFADIHKLLEVLQRLVKLGNSVLVIEHNLDVIKTADYLIDLGPEGGDRGGQLVAVGTPGRGCGERCVVYRASICVRCWPMRARRGACTRIQNGSPKWKAATSRHSRSCTRMEDASQSKPKAFVSDFSMLMVLCRDLVASRDFYRNVMGMRVLNDQVPHWVDLELGEGKRLALHPEGAGRKVTPGTVQLGFAVPNVDKFITDARVMGARILQDPFDAPFGRIAILSDPDGYAVQVYTPRG